MLDLSNLALQDAPAKPSQESSIVYSNYKSLDQIKDIITLIQDELSEPYTIYTYRYFLDDWPHLCFFAHDGALPVGVIVCKQDIHRGKLNRGYIGMLSILRSHRKRGIASELIRLAIERMQLNGAQEIVLETEVDNSSALALYERLGFIREKRLHAFYLNRKSAFRLVLPFPQQASSENTTDTDSMYT